MRRLSLPLLFQAGDELALFVAADLFGAGVLLVFFGETAALGLGGAFRLF